MREGDHEDVVGVMINCRITLPLNIILTPTTPRGAAATFFPIEVEEEEEDAPLAAILLFFTMLPNTQTHPRGDHKEGI